MLLIQPLLVGEAFGLADYARIGSGSALVATVGITIGPVLLRELHAHAGDYRAGYLAALRCTLLLRRTARHLAPGTLPTITTTTDPAARPAPVTGGTRGIGLGSERVATSRGSADDEAHQVEAVERFGRLDLLGANAAVNPQCGPPVEAVLSAVRKVFEGNLTAVLGWVQQAWRLGCPSTAGPSWR